MTMRISIDDASNGEQTGPIAKAWQWMIHTYNSVFGHEQSHEELRGKLQALFDAMDGNGWMHFVREIFDDTVVYEARTMNPSESDGRKMYQQSYRVKDDDSVELTGDPTEVKEERRYVPVNSAAGGNPVADNRKGSSMTKTELVASLIASAATKFTDADQKWLASLSECELQALKDDKPITLTASRARELLAVSENPPATPPAEPAKKPEATPPAKPAKAPETPPATPPAQPTASADKFDLSTLPPDMRESVERAMERDKAEKETLVKAIVASAGNTFSEEDLKAKNLKELEALAKLARVEVDHSALGGAPRTSESDSDVPDPQATWDLNKKAETAAA